MPSKRQVDDPAAVYGGGEPGGWQGNAILSRFAFKGYGVARVPCERSTRAAQARHERAKWHCQAACLLSNPFEAARGHGEPNARDNLLLYSCHLDPNHTTREGRWRQYEGVCAHANNVRATHGADCGTIVGGDFNTLSYSWRDGAEAPWFAAQVSDRRAFYMARGSWYLSVVRLRCTVGAWNERAHCTQPHASSIQHTAAHVVAALARVLA